MKKSFLIKQLFLSLVILLASSSLFAKNFFAGRIFEIKANVPVNISNNVFELGDILQKELLLDFQQITNDMPKKGFDTTIQAFPEFGIKLNIPKGLIVGVNAGVEVFSNITISKDLFEFLSTGHDFTEDENFSTSINGYADVFAYAQIDMGWNFKKMTIVAQPSFFASLAHANANNAYAKFFNNDTGAFGYDINALFDIYSPFELSSDCLNNTNYLVSQAMKSVGLDIGGTVTWDLFKYLSVNGKVRFPLVPSRLDVYTPYLVNSVYNVSIDNVIGGNTESPEFKTEMGEASTTKYIINRPAKFYVGGDFHPWKSLMSMYGGVGIGFKHPGAKNKNERGAYLDYLAGVKLSLFNIISVYASTERTDEVYIHKGTLAFNLRLLEVDAGVAYESASLSKSFSGSGLGAFATVCIGF